MRRYKKVVKTGFVNKQQEEHQPQTHKQKVQNSEYVVDAQMGNFQRVIINGEYYLLDTDTGQLMG